MAKPLKLTPSRAHTVARKKSAAPSVKEHESQVALFEWAKWAVSKYPDLEYMYAIPNGFPLYGEQKYAIVNYMKAEGLKNGVPDVCIPCPRGNYAGMYIERKIPGGVTSKEQDKYIAYLGVHYKVVVTYSFEEDVAAIKAYLGDD